MSRFYLAVLLLPIASPMFANEPINSGEPSQPGIYAGESSLFVNDFFGDGHDRWRTGSWTKSWFWDESWRGKTLELRFRAEIISPWTPARQGLANDRIYANAIGLGAFSHDRWGALEYNLGGEVLITGDQTGLHKLHSLAHEILRLEDSYDPDARNDRRLGNGVHGLVSGEIARSFGRGLLRIRPYAAAGIGYETALTVGADVFFGQAAWAENLARSVVTGMPVATDQDIVTLSERTSLTYVVGFDAAHVFDSIDLPSDGDVGLSEKRYRLRAGVQARHDDLRVFFGQVWLSEEFDSQVEPQRLGMLSVDWRF